MTTKKTERQRVRPRLGDVVEVPLPDGRLAYVQYVNKHREPPRFGALIRVLDGVFAKRPDNFAALVQRAERFSTFFPLGIACARGLTTIVSNEAIPEQLRDKWPLFKARNENFETGERVWYLWDGKNSTRIEKLPPQYYDLPLKQVMTLGFLEDRITSGWRPRDEVRERDKA